MFASSQLTLQIEQLLFVIFALRLIVAQMLVESLIALFDFASQRLDDRTVLLIALKTSRKIFDLLDSNELVELVECCSEVRRFADLSPERSRCKF